MQVQIFLQLTVMTKIMINQRPNRQDDAMCHRDQVMILRGHFSVNALTEIIVVIVRERWQVVKSQRPHDQFVRILLIRLGLFNPMIAVD